MPTDRVRIWAGRIFSQANLYILLCHFGIGCIFPLLRLIPEHHEQEFHQDFRTHLSLPAATIYFLALALQYLPISIAIITRVSRSWACDKHLRISVALE